MKNVRLLAIALLVPFTALTAYTIYDIGVLAVFEHQMASSGGWLVFVDLAIALLFIMIWMVPDARPTGRNPWPYIVITLIAGSFGPLFYLALSKPRESDH